MQPSSEGQLSPPWWIAAMSPRRHPDRENSASLTLTINTVWDIHHMVRLKEHVMESPATESLANDLPCGCHSHLRIEECSECANILFKKS